MISESIYELLGQELGEKYDTYYLDQAPDDANCPYIQMYSIYDSPSQFKDCESGNFNLDVHVWHYRLDKRKEVANIMDDILRIAKQLKIEGHSIMCLCDGMRMLVDNSTSTTYLHGVITLNFKYI